MTKIYKLKNKKTGEGMYPLTIPQAVIDPTTKKTVREELDELKEIKVEEKKETVLINVSGIESGYTVIVKDSLGFELGVITESSATLYITEGTEYTVEANSVSGYTSPESQIFVAVGGNTRNVNVTYYKDEIVTVTVVGAESGAGFTITVKGEHDVILGTSTEAVSVFSIPVGTLYTVLASTAPGYIGGPNSWGYFTAEAGGSRSFTMVYTKRTGTQHPENGVYIKDTDGYYNTVEEWEGKFTPDCIAVITDSCEFGIALSEKTNMTIFADDQRPITDTLTAVSDETAARLDYDGEGNTAKLLTLQSSEEYAAGYCSAFTFPSGKNGYLPSIGEWCIVYDNMAIIDEALEVAGGAAFAESNKHLSSTFQGTSVINSTTYYEVWGIYLDSDGRISGSDAIGDYRVVRPFCSLD